MNKLLYFYSYFCYINLLLNREHRYRNLLACYNDENDFRNSICYSLMVGNIEQWFEETIRLYKIISFRVGFYILAGIFLHCYRTFLRRL